MTKQILKENLIAIKKCLQRRGNIEQDMYFNRAQRWLYTIKAIICIALNRWWDGQWDYADNYAVIGIYQSGQSANYDYGGTQYWWYQIEVATSWRDWHVIMSSDGD